MGDRARARELADSPPRARAGEPRIAVVEAGEVDDACTGRDRTLYGALDLLTVAATLLE